jgi:hypothetical protein
VKSASVQGLGVALVFLGLVVSACARPVGWFRVDKTPTTEDAYDERFEPLTLTADAGCDSVRPREDGTPAPIIVLVPGIGGDGDEMHQAVPVLMATHPAAMFMFRYSPFEQLGPISERLAIGLSRLEECKTAGVSSILVLSHSAGGTVAGFAVNQVKPTGSTEGTWLTLLTVASPLAGTSGLPLGADADPKQVRLMGLMGLRHTYYPAPAAGVRVVHLRTSALSDGYMRPSREHIPNDPHVGVPGAAQFDLPAELDHPTSLVYVAKRIADGTWSEWLKAPAPASSDSVKSVP